MPRGFGRANFASSRRIEVNQSHTSPLYRKESFAYFAQLELVCLIAPHSQETYIAAN